MHNRYAEQRGFSLLELIVVIVIVALVIYAGLPQFENTLKQSHETAVKLTARALQAGVERAKAIQMLDGLGGAVYNLPRFGDGTLDLNAAGFPIGTSRQSGDRWREQHCAEIWGALLEANPEDKNGQLISNYHATLNRSGKSPICVYIYQHGGNMSISYDPASGRVSTDAQFKGSAFSR